MVFEILHTTKKEGYVMDFYPDNIVYVKFDGATKITLDKIKELKKDGFDQFKGKKFRSITDFRNTIDVLTDEAKKFVANDPEFNKFKICEALITTSFLTSFLFGIYLKVFKPKTITKSFSNFDDALKWIEKFS